jgi:hypothetical protein
MVEEKFYFIFKPTNDKIRVYFVDPSIFMARFSQSHLPFPINLVPHVNVTNAKDI